MINQAHLLLIFSEITAERRRQEEKWGEQNHYLIPKSMNIENFKTLNEYYHTTNVNGGESWHDIILEELYEALSETDIDKQREEFIQVAAVAVQIIEYLDRNLP